ncbi:MAG: hypothetical protein J0I40_03325 [Cellulomonas sp.]|uniref:DUF5808 domain-containing protein n=1 Tax=Cellulomonas sp. 73-92 TaxID=1895740 RepID=UPI000929B8E7|nr:DUF5808 domain-containing protein [Cellulomonas sp. 73-92]MBN9374424.1 hypothetical protein [Cellulomonas sp.]OJV81193.1 MAG: hypothetical protein BGO37_17170 [Cellulomonas sp. 73-92]
MSGKTSKKRGGFRNLVTLVTIALGIAAVVKELRKPADERTWNGTVAAVVPYDFRMPTLERAKERLWNPEASSFVGPRVFGVGWTVNVGKIWALVQEKRAAH